MRLRWHLPVLALSAILSAAAATAQSTAQVPLEFDFLNPGARSVGLGGAFSAVADDATAAFTNPAGLVQLVDPEISFEPRLLVTRSRFLAGGRLSGVPTGEPPDTHTAPVYASDIDPRLVPSFASAVFPSRSWAAAVYFQQVTKTHNTILDEGAFERLTFGNELTDRSRDDALEGTRSIGVTSTGASFGWRATPALAIGAGIILQRLSLDSAFARYGFATTIFGPFDRTRVDARQTQYARSWGLGWQLGATQTVGSTVRVGAVVRVGAAPEFEQVDSSAVIGRVERHGRFKIPNVIAVGGIWQPKDTIAVISEVTRISYSRLKHDYVDFQTLATDTVDQIRLDDGYEFHIGTEWTFVKDPPRISPVLRFGTWFDPAHAVRFVSLTNSPGEIRLAAALPGTTGRWHVAAGVGVPVSRRFEFHAGADASSRSLTLSVSGIARFVRKKEPVTATGL
jgi:long-subunit fatty acid transport protein